ncbi:MAG: O-antigen ligase family protein [Planctomyces sp.]|nr:O-antigen ligase family protein [Planctomyces sp.]
MLKSLLYIVLVGLGFLWGLGAPLHAAIVNLQMYFVDPKVMIRDSDFQRYQFISFMLLPSTLLIYGTGRLRKVGNEGRTVVCMWLYGLVCIASSLWAVVDAEVAYAVSTEFFKTIMVAGLLPFVVRNRRDFDLLVVACLIGVAHFAFLETIGKHHTSLVGKAQRILTDRHGSVLLLFLPLTLLLGMYGKKWERLMCWGMVPLILDVIIRNNHRAYFVGIIVQMGLFAILLPKRVVVKVMPIMLAGVLLFVFVLTPPQYWNRMATITSPTEESSANSRFVINKASLEMLKDYPLGVGYKNYARVMNRYIDGDMTKAAHNTFFSVACQTGFLGFGLWSTAVFGSLVLFRRVRRRLNFRNIDRLALYGMGFEIGLYGTLAGDCFHNGHETDPVYWFVSFGVIMTRLHKRFPQQEIALPTLDRAPLYEPLRLPSRPSPIRI